MDDQHYIQDMTERYVYQVVRRLPAKIRGDIEQELRGLISDMLDARLVAGGSPAAKKEMNVVLAELGDPALFAAKYQGEQRSLIGPALFPQYLFLLKIVLAAVAGGMTIASVILSILSPSSSWLTDLGRWLANLLSAFGMAFTWVTLIFAFLEWRGVSLGLFSEENPLPPVPVRHERISRWEPISSIVFTCFAAILFLFLPQAIAAVISVGGKVTFLSVFDEAALRSALPLFLICFGLGILRECCKLIEGRYTMRLAAATLACDLPAMALCVFIFSGGAIWNQNLGPVIDTIADFGPDFSFALFWGYFTRFFVEILLFAYLLSIGTTLFRAFRYRQPKEG